MIHVDQDGKRNGFLIDWELSCLQCELAKGPVKPDRIGTWQFRSALSLRYPRKPSQRSDDIESFIHAYIYLVLRYHPTSVEGLRAKVESLFETMSLIEGIKIGGSAKIAMLRTGDLGSEIIGNPYLQELIDDILEHCKRTYANINYTKMEQLYGPVRTPAQPGPPTQHGEPPKTKSRKKPSVLRASDDEGSSGAGLDDNLHSLSIKSPRKEEEAQLPSAAPADPCKIGSFLSNPKALMKLLARHAEETYEFDDKAPDQFLARRNQDIFRSSEDTSLRSIGSSSTTGSLSLEHASEDAPIGFVRESDMPMFTADLGSNVVGGGPSSISPTISKKRRERDEEPVEEATAHDEERSLDSVHRNKRVKYIPSPELAADTDSPII